MNALDMGGPPPAPQPDPNNPNQVNGGAMGGMGNAFPQSGAPQGGPVQQRPAPSHAQTVATLLHLHAFEQMYRGLAAMPELGKNNIRPKIIDGVVNLVSERFISAGQAAQLMGGVPDDPPEQKKWVMQHFAKDRAAEAILLAHHAQGSPEGIGYDETPMAGRPDDHLGAMGGMMTMYGQRQ